ncbi:MAG: DUF3696 domain-containing protein [Deferribacteraceae bacterium]|jgi:predicted ATPase|nr:DUF3696 domain-containing protein [Deferribacteraceae bacterium]
MLKSLRIQNFKAWKDTGEIRMAPITLLFGGNSSGKSSIGQFLMMLAQTTASPDRRAVFNSGNKNTAVQLGSYKEMVHKRDPEKQISFSYCWNINDPKDTILDRIFDHNKLCFFDANIFLSEATPKVKTLNYTLVSVIDHKWAFGMEYDTETGLYKMSTNFEISRRLGRPALIAAPLRFYGFPDEVVANYNNVDFLQDFNLYQERLFESIYYLGPLRSKAERLYSWTGIRPDSVGYSGENTIAALLAAKDRKIAHGKKKSEPFLALIARQLKEMNLIDDFKVEKISKTREDYEVQVRTHGSDQYVDLPDVGFGISQVLPVLVQAYYAPHNSIIIMEQPEIHLHPDAQARLADVMIDVIKSKENGILRNVQLIIETHSEHFLRRLQRRIAEERITTSDVAMYFANKLKLAPLEVDENGRIANWPENFFGNTVEDIMTINMAAAKRVKK